MDVILGTAGHIDHGKTTLVHALTGINCDRLDEEQRRGITIELGFAWLDLPDGRRLGIVDVPGHERFIKNMVAGASGVDVVMLVIAADEGVMPQTREHLEICSLLGARCGLVALTKTDLVDQELLELATEDIRSALAGSFLEGAAIVPVSATTGEGLDLLKKEIMRQIGKLAERHDNNLLRLPVDRVFSMKGHGTVVTGTLISGSCVQGEQLCVMPEGRLTRCRSLQVHNAPVERAHAGQRCAINLQGLEREEVRRGDVIARPDTLFPSRRWIVRLKCLASSPLPIRQRMEVHVHHGAHESLARIVLRDRVTLEPGHTDVAEIRFPQPTVAIYGDHFVIRAHSPLRTIGGGIVLNPWPPILNRRTEDLAEKWAIIQELGNLPSDNPDPLAGNGQTNLPGACLALYPAPGLDLAHLRILTGLAEDKLLASLKTLVKQGLAFPWDGEKAWIAARAMQKCIDRVEQRASELHAREPLKSFFAPDSLVAGWGSHLPDKFIQAVLEAAVSQGKLEETGRGLKLATHKISLDKSDHEILETILAKIKAGGMTPPFIKTLLEELGWDPKKVQPILQYLGDSGQLLKIQEGVYYDPEEFSQLTAKIRALLEENETIEVADLKNILGLTRKYSIPVLEYLDSIRVTYRAGNQRRLRKS